jgi:hypothetical protein
MFGYTGMPSEYPGRRLIEFSGKRIVFWREHMKKASRTTRKWVGTGVWKERGISQQSVVLFL